MRQFINGTDAAFGMLGERAAGTCVRFRAEEMPPGATPSHADVAFQVGPNDGSAVLLVERGIRYRGCNAAARDWLRDGRKECHGFDELRLWIREELGPCYEGSVSAAAPELGGPDPCPPLGPEELTDLADVKNRLPETNVPLLLDEDGLFREVAAVVRGQEDALRTLAREVSHHCARRNPRRPKVLLAVGPTGIGKTRASEALPAAMRSLDPRGCDYSYLRLDMSEYQERHRVSQLLGAPQGYVGYGDGAQLTDALIANPRTVVLFDEIEKAHPNILRTLMNAMDAGRLSTAGAHARSREIDCRRAIFLFTSNLDAEGILRELEERQAYGDQTVVDEVCRSHFRAARIADELIGRIGRFLVFRPLSSETKAEIVAMEVAGVASEYGLTVSHVEPSVVLAVLDHLGDAGFGVRPIQYLVDDMLGACFARAARTTRRGTYLVRGGSSPECLPISDNGAGSPANRTEKQAATDGDSSSSPD